MKKFKIKSRKARTAVYTGIAVFCFALLFFLLRGPYLSNYTKRLIIPALENATRERIIMDKAVINLLPFYLQAKGVKVFDKDGNKLLLIRKTRAYIDLTGLFTGEIRIRKFTLREPRLNITREEIENVVRNVKDYMSKGGGKKLGVTLKGIELSDGELSLRDVKGERSFSGSGMFFSMTRDDKTSAKVSFTDTALKLPDLSEIKGNISGKVVVENDRIEIADLNITALKSKLETEGEIFLTPGGRIGSGLLKGNAEIHVSSLNELFSLKQKKDGLLKFDGSVRLVPGKDSKWPGVSLDLYTDGRFYLETLMEMAGVDKDIRGELSLEGGINGVFPDVTGTGDAVLKNAFFVRLPLDDVAGKVRYENQKFSMSDFTAHTYGGSMKGSAFITIPHAEYLVAADMTGVISPEFFRFIRWEPPFPEGEIGGSVLLEREHEQKMKVTADLDYMNTTLAEGNVLDRIKTMHARLELQDGLLKLEDTALSTEVSELRLGGDIDLKNRTMALDLRLHSGDIADLTAPFYSRLVSSAVFKGTAGGPVDDPVITGRLEAGSGSVHGIEFTAAFSDFSYSRSQLDVKRLKIEHGESEYDASGSIEFREAEGLFSFKGPFYRATASVRNAEIRPFIKASYRDIPVSGLVDGLLAFKGDAEKFRADGNFTINDSVIYGQDVDMIEMETVLNEGGMEFKSVKARVKESILNAQGTISFDESYKVRVYSENFDTCYVHSLAEYPLSAEIAFDARGSGTFYNPGLEFSVRVLESYLNEVKTGSGEIQGELSNWKLRTEGTFMDGSITAGAEADLSGDQPLWNAELKVRRDRYDFLIEGFLADVPEDIAVSMEGDIRLKSSGRGVSAHYEFPFTEIVLYGYRFRNDKKVELVLEGDELAIRSFSFSDRNASLSATGSMRIGKDYDVTLNGELEISPLKAFTERIETVEGRGRMAVDIRGPWEKPEYLGQVEVQNASIKLTGFRYGIGPLNGIFYLDRDRITFDSVRSGFAGGQVIVSGVGYMEKVALRKLYLSSVLRDVKIRPMEGVNAVFGGRLFYERSDEGTMLTGNIDIKRAEYERKVEFGKLLFGLREIRGGGTDYMDFLGETELNIHVKGTDNIMINNNIARTPVTIDLNIMGNVSKKGLIGRIQANKGNIYFRSNEFTVLEGSSVDFVDPNSITPIFHILAETYISDYYIRMNLDGTTDRFDLSLFSDPPLSEMEILSLLTFGQVNKEAKGFESGLAAGEAASILTGDIQEVVEERFKNITGVEYFTVEPHTTTTGSVSPKVTVGKRVLEDKLSVLYSTSIGTSEENIIRLEYKISKKFSLVGSRNELGSAGMDLKYRFEFR